MNKISREFKTGVVAILVISLFIWGYNYLKGYNLFDGPSDTYFTRYNNVQGLNTASPVTVNGYTIGKIVDIDFDTDPDKQGELIVEFSITEPFTFSKNSVARIYSASLMGGKSLAIIPSYVGETAEPGDFLKGEIESDIFSSVGEKLNPLQAKLERVITSADSLLVHVNSILNPTSRMHINNSIANLDATMENLKRLTLNAELLVIANRQSLQNSVNNVENITGNFSKLSDTLVQADIGAMIAKLDATIENIEGITEGLENGEGSLGKFIKDDAVYVNLDKATKELGELLEDFKLHPKRYVNVSVFGKKEKPYVKPEESQE